MSPGSRGNSTKLIIVPDSRPVQSKGLSQPDACTSATSKDPSLIHPLGYLP